jgi:prenyltransferase beta subunit
MKRLVPVVLILVVGLPAVRAQTAAEKAATVRYLQGLQASDGGFLPAAPDPASNRLSKSSLRATSAGLRALKYFGGAPRDRKAAAAFVGQCFDKETGGFADLPAGKPDVATTAVGLMAVVELKMPQEPFVAPAVKYLAERARTFEEIRIAAAGLEAVNKRPEAAAAWLKEVAKLRRDDGTYGKDDGAARDTGGAAVVVLRLGGKVEQRDNVLKVLRAGQRDDGGFGKAGEKGSDLETSYRVMRCFWMMKEKPDAARLKAFVAKCRNADGGYGVAPGKESAVSSTYFAGIILHWLEGK